jgi:serine/threonine protein kinase
MINQASTQNIPCYKHIPFKDGCKFVGTPRYASLNTHQGLRQSRRDDLESIAYILIYFILGDLPWQGVKAKTKSEKKEKIRLMKYSLQVDTEQMFKSLPAEFREFLKICREMSYELTPDYKRLKSLLISVRQNFNISENPMFLQWEEMFVGNKPYIDMKKAYKTLYEGYPVIPVSDYIEYLLDKKKIANQSKINTDNSDISLLETQTQSEINKSKSSNFNLSSNTFKLPQASLNINLKNQDSNFLNKKRSSSNNKLLIESELKNSNLPNSKPVNKPPKYDTEVNNFITANFNKKNSSQLNCNSNSLKASVQHKRVLEPKKDIFKLSHNHNNKLSINNINPKLKDLKENIANITTVTANKFKIEITKNSDETYNESNNEDGDLEIKEANKSSVIRINLDNLKDDDFKKSNKQMNSNSIKTKTSKISSNTAKSLIRLELEEIQNENTN